MTDRQILRIAQRDGCFEVDWKWRNDALRGHCRSLMNKGLLVMVYSRGFDRFEITQEGRDYLNGG